MAKEKKSTKPDWMIKMHEKRDELLMLRKRARTEGEDLSPAASEDLKNISTMLYRWKREHNEHRQEQPVEQL